MLALIPAPWIRYGLYIYIYDQSMINKTLNNMLGISWDWFCWRRKPCSGSNLDVGQNGRPRGPQMWMSSLVLTIQLLGCLILTHTHFFGVPVNFTPRKKKSSGNGDVNNNMTRGMTRKYRQLCRHFSKNAEFWNQTHGDAYTLWQSNKCNSVFF